MEEKWIRKGHKIWLRMMTQNDTERIVEWRNRDFVKNRFLYREPFTKQGHENWIRTQVEAGHAVQMIICLADSRKPVGSVYFRDIDTKNRKAEYGIFIGEEELLGKGIGTETARLALAYAFEELGLHKVMLRVLEDNLRARASYEHAGFREEACLRDEVFLDGKYRNIVLMGMINPKERESIADE